MSRRRVLNNTVFPIFDYNYITSSAGQWKQYQYLVAWQIVKMRYFISCLYFVVISSAIT